MNDKMVELLQVVAELADKYTSKESSSISYDNARMLMNAVIYCINEYKGTNENRIGEEEYNLEANGIDVRTSYRMGYENVLRKVHQSKELYEQVIIDFHYYGNQSYYDTIILGMPGFFLYYDPKFNPQNHLLTLDYPILKPIYHMCGVDAIYSYLHCIQLEQIFLKEFKEDDIRSLLIRYSNNYEELLINVCSLVLRTVLGCMITGQKVSKLKVEEKDYVEMKEFVTNHSYDELNEILRGLIRRLMGYGYDDNKALYEYLCYDVEDFVVELLNAVEHDCFNAVLP